MQKLTAYDKANNVVYNPSGYNLKSYAEHKQLIDAGADVLFYLKGAISARIIINTDGVGLPLLWINDNKVSYTNDPTQSSVVTIDLPRSGSDAPRKDVIKVRRVGAGSNDQSVTLIYDKIVL